MSDDNIIDLAQYIAGSGSQDEAEVNWKRHRDHLRNHYAKIAEMRGISDGWADEKADLVIALVQDVNSMPGTSAALELPPMNDEMRLRVHEVIQEWGNVLRRDIAIQTLQISLSYVTRLALPPE